MSNIENFASTSEKLLEKVQEMDEANTKAKFIRPFLEDVLEWDFTTDVKLEYGVRTGSGTSKVDYALLDGDQPKIFVEAKSLSRRIRKEHEKQLFSYLKLQNVDFGILSNGKEFRFYKREITAGT